MRTYLLQKTHVFARTDILVEGAQLYTSLEFCPYLRKMNPGLALRATTTYEPASPLMQFIGWQNAMKNRSYGSVIRKH
jgi:hypothetical protein